MYERAETEYFTAKRKAAAALGVGTKWQTHDLPSNREIRDQLQAFAKTHEGEQRYADLAAMRVAALHMMRLLEPFKPRLIGSVWTGHIRAGSDIDLHVFSHSGESIADLLEYHGYFCKVEHKRVIKHNEERFFTHIHLEHRFKFELTVYSPDLLNYVFKSSITGKAMERASVDELEQLIQREHPHADLANEDEPQADASYLWLLLLQPLANVKQNPIYHPEGDALYHSLQAFELARDARPYDAELITAALLHDVGKAIDRKDHVGAALEALEGTLTAREHFLIAHHMDAQALLCDTLGHKLRRRLQQSEWFDDVMLLREIDTKARVPGVDVCTPQEALDYLDAMNSQYDD